MSKKTKTTPTDSEQRADSPAPLDRAKATSIDPARRHEPTGKTIAWEQDGHLYTATGVPVAPAEAKS